MGGEGRKGGGEPLIHIFSYTNAFFEPRNAAVLVFLSGLCIGY